MIDGLAQILSLAVAATQPQDSVAATVQRFIDEKYLHAVVVGIVDQKQQRLQCFALPGVPLSGETRFEIGSITKTFTSLLLADAVMQNELKLDDPVQKYLPAGVTLARKGDRPIELIDLATHRSGLPRLPGNLELTSLKNPYADYSQEKMDAYLNGWKPSRAPGEAAEYSNVAVGLLGDLLGQQQKTRYTDLVRQRVLSPLKMGPDNGQKNLIDGHNADGEVLSHWDFSNPIAGAGALRLSGEDMLKYLDAEIHPPAGKLGDAIKLTQHPRSEFDANNYIGLGWLINSDHYLWHNGETGGFHSFIGFDPNRGVGVFVLSDSNSQWSEVIGVTLLRQMLDLPTQPLPTLHQEIAATDEQMDRLVGNYAVGFLKTLTVAKRQGHLVAMMTGQSPARIYLSSPTEAFWKVAAAEATFELPAGSAHALSVEIGQGTQMLRGKRMPDAATAATTQPR